MRILLCTLILPATFSQRITIGQQNNKQYHRRNDRIEAVRGCGQYNTVVRVML